MPVPGLPPEKYHMAESPIQSADVNTQFAVPKLSIDLPVPELPVNLPVNSPVNLPDYLRMCFANHGTGYFSNVACDWLSIV